MAEAVEDVEGFVGSRSVSLLGSRCLGPAVGSPLGPRWAALGPRWVPLGPVEFRWLLKLIEVRGQGGVAGGLGFVQAQESF